MGWELLTRMGLLALCRVKKGGVPKWVTLMRGWRWSYHYSDLDIRRRWMKEDDLVRATWAVSLELGWNLPASIVVGKRAAGRVLSLSCRWHAGVARSLRRGNTQETERFMMT